MNFLGTRATMDRRSDSSRVALDIVIPTYNNSQVFARCLTALEIVAPHRHQLLVVDDGSDCAHRERIEKLLGGVSRAVRLLTHAENRGFKESIITAMGSSQAKYVLLLNDDTVPTQDFDLKLLEVIQADDKTRAVGPVSNHPSDLFQYRPELRRITGDNGAGPLELMAEFMPAQLRRGVHEVPFLTGMCLLLDRRVFASLGYFGDEYEHGYFEDLDVCCRIRELGYRLMVNEDCFVYHTGHETYRHKGTTEKRRIIMKNFNIYERKWAHLPEHEELLRKMQFAGNECPI